MLPGGLRRASALYAVGGESGVFVTKLALDGDLVWNRRPTDCGYAMDVAIDSSGYIYVTGLSHCSFGSPVVNPHSGWGDVFVVKMNAAGNIIWSTFIGTLGGLWEGTGIALDSSGSILVSPRAVVGFKAVMPGGTRGDATGDALPTITKLVGLLILGLGPSTPATLILRIVVWGVAWLGPLFLLLYKWHVRTREALSDMLLPGSLLYGSVMLLILALIAVSLRLSFSLPA